MRNRSIQVRLSLLIIIAVCLTPIILNALGITFSSHQEIEFNVPNNISFVEKSNLVHNHLAGSFIHTILEWTAFCSGVFVAILGLTYFYLRRNLGIAILSMSIFCAGCMDAFHTLAADRLIQGNAPNENLIPFTWVLCRIFNASVLGLGGLIILLTGRMQIRNDILLICISSVLFILATYFVVHLCTISYSLPQTMYPTSIITRPYDVIPLILYSLLAILFTYVYKKDSNAFIYSIVISLVAHIFTQLHMSFGSIALFDNHFNIAHFLKIVAYIIPFLGLCATYIETYIDYIDQKKLKDEIEKSNAELTQFAYVASHDLKGPLRAINSLSDWIKEDLQENKNVDDYVEKLQNKTKFMNNLIDGLLEYSRIGRQNTEKEYCNIKEIINGCNPSVANVNISVNLETKSVLFNKTRLSQVFCNLIENAVKHSDKEDIEITISSKDNTFCVSDNGSGIDPKFHEKIFQIFQTLQPKDDSGSTGIGLTLVKKIIEENDGKIWVESELGKGASFYFALPNISTKAQLFLN